MQRVRSPLYRFVASAAASLAAGTASADVTSFTLIDADSDRPLRALRSGETIDLAALPTKRLSVRANVDRRGGSVRFTLNGRDPFKVENDAPYSLTGDVRGNYNPLRFRPANHTVTARQFSGKNGRGSAGPAKTVRFTMIDTGSAPVAGRSAAGRSAPAPAPAPAVNRAAPAASKAAIPQYDEWLNKMRQFGKRHCDHIVSGAGSFDERLNDFYYDATSVYYQMADFLGEASWRRCADAAVKVYRDEYVAPNGGLVWGHYVFTKGLREHFRRTGDQSSRAAAVSVAKNAYFSRDQMAAVSTETVVAAREVGYAILAHLDAAELGDGTRARLSLLVDHALGHVGKWVDGWEHFRPWMIGLEAQGLIAYYEKTGDPRIIPALRRAADAMWDRAWLPGSEAFVYATDERSPAPDLNLLAAPMYAFLWAKTGDVKYRDRGDAIFAGGVKNSWLYNVKAFNQNYRWSFDYVKWRNER